jgi:hypothetical protein
VICVESFAMRSKQGEDALLVMQSTAREVDNLHSFRWLFKHSSKRDLEGAHYFLANYWTQHLYCNMSFELGQWRNIDVYFFTLSGVRSSMYSGQYPVVIKEALRQSLVICSKSQHNVFISHGSNLFTSEL